MELLWPTLALLALVVIVFAAERRYPELVSRIEENILATLLAIITFVSFTQVIARYGFNTGWSGALEFTRVMFAWMILFGMSYGIKHGVHLGVDAFVRLLPSNLFRLAALFAAVCVFLYAFVLLYAGWLALLGVDVSTRQAFYRAAQAGGIEFANQNLDVADLKELERSETGWLYGLGDPPGADEESEEDEES